MGSVKKFCPSEVAQHTSADDSWLIIHGKVYDITKLLHTHPGGANILLKYAGRDATQPFDDVGHSMKSLLYDIAPGSCLGELDVPIEGKQENEQNHTRGKDDRNIQNEKRERESWFGGNAEEEEEEEENNCHATVRSMGSQSEKLDYDFQVRLKNILLLIVIVVCCLLLIGMRCSNYKRKVRSLGSDLEWASTDLDSIELPDWIEAISV